MDDLKQWFPVLEHEQAKRRAEAIDRLLDLRAQAEPVTAERILAARDELRASP